MTDGAASIPTQMISTILSNSEIAKKTSFNIIYYSSSSSVPSVLNSIDDRLKKGGMNSKCSKVYSEDQVKSAFNEIMKLN